MGDYGQGGESDRGSEGGGRKGADSITAAKTGWFRTGVCPVALLTVLSLLVVSAYCLSEQCVLPPS